MVRDKRAFQPFNLGRHSCPGKNIGLMELRITIAVLIAKFEVSLAPGEDGKEVTDKLRDTFTAQPGDLHLSFKPVA
jgi:tryprostatin B 6-hydroxylase